MDNQAKEKLYDDVVAPKLAELAKLCEDNSLSMVAACEWAPGEYGSTVTLRAGSGYALRLADATIKSSGNVDSLWMAISKDAVRNGHSSMVLQSQGIPTTPATATTAKNKP